MNNKTTLRARFRRLRDALTPDEVAVRSRQIAQRVLEMDEVKRAGSVFVYVSTGSEVQTHDLIDALLSQHKIVLVPRSTPQPGQMQAVPITSRGQLVRGRFNLIEPIAGLTPADATPDVTLLPGVAFHPTSGGRLGMGAGYYDRYLAAHPATLPVALAYEMQLSDEVSAEAHDMPCRLIVTEMRVVRCPTIS